METIESLQQNLSRYLKDLNDYTIIKTIGRGGYGKVDIGINKITGEKVAIKELFLSELKGRDLKMYCREIQILSELNSPFLLKLNGFTITHPYCIITNYIENGSLFDALHRKNNVPVLTPSNKTIIAMGIAYGMNNLHKMDIIHRDMKSLNVLLDSNLYPKICDFGISRFRKHDPSALTLQVGTPHWMAPELYDEHGYNNKVDVFAYGIILWEILTNQTPFRGRSPAQIMMAICNKGERPLFPKDTPKCMMDLINLCWFQTPQERPTFEQIYKLFAEKKVMYTGTKEEEVDKFLKYIEKEEQKERRNNLPIYNLNANIIEEKPATKKFDLLLNDIRDYNNTKFDSTLDLILKGISEVNYNDYFNTINEILLTNPPNAVISKLIDNCSCIVYRDNNAKKEFNESKILSKICPPNEETIKSFCNIIDFIDISLLNIDTVKKIVEICVVKSPLPVTDLLVKLYANENNSHNIEQLNDILFENFMSFINKEDIVKIVSNIDKIFGNKHMKQHKSRLSFLIQNLLVSENFEQVKIIYRGLHMTNVVFPEDEIVKLHLQNVLLQDSLLDYLCNVDSTKYTLSKESNLILINLCNKKKGAVLALSNLMMNIKNAKNTILHFASLAGNCDPIDAIQVISSIVNANQGLATEILQQQKAPEFIISVLKEKEVPSFSTIAFLFLSSNVTEKIVEKFNEFNFVNILIKCAIEDGTNPALFSMLTILDILSDAYKELSDKLLEKYLPQLLENETIKPIANVYIAKRKLSSN